MLSATPNDSLKVKALYLYPYIFLQLAEVLHVFSSLEWKILEYDKQKEKKKIHIKIN